VAAESAVEPVAAESAVEPVAAEPAAEPVAAEPAVEPVAAESVMEPAPPPAGWEELRASGWRVDRAADGSTLLYPPPLSVPDPPKASGPEGASPIAVPWERMRDLGWGVERTADGSVLLFPPPLHVELSIAGPEPEPTGPEAATTADPLPWEALRAHGWRLERDADGTLNLFPPGRSAAGPDASGEEGAPVASPDPQEGGLSRLGDALAGRGWRVERAEDGSLLLHPVTEAPAAAAGQPATPVR
jgi:hypothetical protein